MKRSNYTVEKILREWSSSRANCVVSNGGAPAGEKGISAFSLFFFLLLFSPRATRLNGTRNYLTSFPSGTANSHCEPSTGDANASPEYAAVATPAMPKVVVTKEKGQSS